MQTPMITGQHCLMLQKNDHKDIVVTLFRDNADIGVVGSCEIEYNYNHGKCRHQINKCTFKPTCSLW